MDERESSMGSRLDILMSEIEDLDRQIEKLRKSRAEKVQEGNTLTKEFSQRFSRLATSPKMRRNGLSPRREIEKILVGFEPGREVTQGEIREELKRRYPEHEDSFRPASVSSALRRVVEAGALVCVSKGVGSEPNVYRKPYLDGN